MFKKIHLKIKRCDFRAVEIPEGFEITPIEPNFSGFMQRISSVGDDWHLRKIYNESVSRKNISKAIQDGMAWVFKRHGVEIGFCYTIENSYDLKNSFRNSASDGQVVEIYKVGLFPEHTGLGYGRFMIPAVLEQLFNSGADHVYLNTRDTNHVNAVPFYERIGFEVFHTEILPDDLIAVPKSVQKSQAVLSSSP